MKSAKILIYKLIRFISNLILWVIYFPRAYYFVNSYSLRKPYA